jgi:hypothetical protein
MFTGQIWIIGLMRILNNFRVFIIAMERPPEIRRKIRIIDYADGISDDLKQQWSTEPIQVNELDLFTVKLITLYATVTQVNLPTLLTKARNERSTRDILRLAGLWIAQELKNTQI